MWALPGSRVIAFDGPGTGRSAGSCISISLGSLAQLTEKLLDRLGYGQVDVLGYFVGGLVAQFLAHRAPDRIRRLGDRGHDGRSRAA